METLTQETFSVSRLNEYVAYILNTDKILGKIVLVYGEISNFKRYPSGHCYFSVKDDDSILKCVLFKGFASKLQNLPQNGETVFLSGKVEVYEKNGEYQLKVFDIIPLGAGEIQSKQELLKDKLQALGMFDRKRKLPKYPKKIGVVTSSAGAAVHDIINVLERRYPLVEVEIFNCLVQGAEAEKSIEKAIKIANTTNCDLLIVGRGGGSKEDLAVYDSEKVAFAIFNSEIPIISAVGHEVDFTIADMVSDLRAPTPSAAAELAVPSLEEFFSKLSQFFSLLNAYSPEKKLEMFEFRLNNLSERLEKYINNLIQSKENRLDYLEDSIKKITYHSLEQGEKSLVAAYLSLENLNPLNVLKRGYGAVYKNGKIISSVKDVIVKDEITIKLSDGEILAEVK